MIRGTTPTLTLKINDDTLDLSQAQSVYVTIRQAEYELEKTGGDLTVDGNTVSVYLTQEESLALIEAARAEVQVNWTYPEGARTARAATKVRTIDIGKQLLPEVIA